MKSIAILFCLLGIFAARGQEGFRQEGSVKTGQADSFKADQFGNTYLLRNEELVKIDKQGRNLYSYSNPVLGDIYQVEVFNPLRPYVFFKDAHRLVVLDNRLNENEQLNLLDHGFLDVQFISFSDQENVWLYDQAQDRLFRFNITDKEITNRSLNLTQLLGSENSPRNMVSTVDNVYLNIPGKGVMVFDPTGAYKKLLPLENLQDFDVKGNTLFALREGNLLMHDLQTAEVLPVAFPHTKLISLDYAGGRLYLFDGNQLHRYLPVKR